MQKIEEAPMSRLRRLEERRADDPTYLAYHAFWRKQHAIDAYKLMALFFAGWMVLQSVIAYFWGDFFVAFAKTLLELPNLTGPVLFAGVALFVAVFSLLALRSTYR